MIYAYKTQDIASCKTLYVFQGRKSDLSSDLSAVKRHKDAFTGFALRFIFLSPPFSPIRFFLCHFLKLRARFLAIFRHKIKGWFWAFLAKKVF